MADTASQKAPARKTLQDEIDYQTSKAGGRMTTFIIRSKDGECDIPAYTNVRLLGCKIESLNVVGASIVCFEDCTLESEDGAFNVMNSTVMVSKGTKIKAPTTFLNSKVEIRESTISRDITLVDTAFLKSVSNIWEGSSNKSKIAVTADNGSRVESYNDAWSKYTDYFWQAKKNSVIKVTNPVSVDHSKSSGNGKGLALADDSSVVIVSHPKDIVIKDNSNPLFTGTKNSNIELYNFPTLSSDSVLFSLNKSKASVRNVTNLKSNKNKIGNLIDSTIDFSNVLTFNSDAQKAIDLFTLVRSTVTFGNATSIKAQGTVFNLDQSNINFVSNSFDYNSDDATGATIESVSNITVKATNSKVFLKNVKTLKSGINQVLDLTGSSFYGTSITNIKGEGKSDSASVIRATGSLLTLTNIKNIAGVGDNAIYLTKSKGSLLNVGTIKSQGTQGAAVRAVDSSAIVCRNIAEIAGQDYGVYLDNRSTLLFKGKTAKITGATKDGVYVGLGCRVTISEADTLSGTTSGVNGYGPAGRIELKDVKNIKGESGLNITGADLLLDNSGLLLAESNTKKVVLSTQQPLGTYKATIIGPVAVTGGLSATNYQINEQGVAWNGDVTTSNCLVNGVLSNITGNIVSVKSHANYTRTGLNQNVSLSDNASIELLSSAVGGDVSVDSSFLKSVLSTLNGSSLSNRSGISADVSNMADVSLADSYLVALSSQVGTVSMSGLSSALGGASQSATLNLGADPTISSPAAYFVTSGGDLGLQAEGTIILEADNYDAKFRGTSAHEAENNITITSLSGSVALTADSQISHVVSSSSILIDSSSIAGSSASITWN